MVTDFQLASGILKTCVSGYQLLSKPNVPYFAGMEKPRLVNLSVLNRVVYFSYS